MNQLINEIISDIAVCRTAPATLGLLTIVSSSWLGNGYVTTLMAAMISQFWHFSLNLIIIKTPSTATYWFI